MVRQQTWTILLFWILHSLNLPTGLDPTLTCSNKRGKKSFFFNIKTVYWPFFWTFQQSSTSINKKCTLHWSMLYWNAITVMSHTCTRIVWNPNKTLCIERHFYFKTCITYQKIAKYYLQTHIYVSIYFECTYISFSLDDIFVPYNKWRKKSLMQLNGLYYKRI